LFQYGELVRNLTIKEFKLRYRNSVLGFSVAIETNPDIFIIDEALAVGDMELQQKCMNKFKDFKEEKATIVLVSYALNLVNEFCEKTVFLSRGEMISFGKSGNTVNEYVKHVGGRS